MRAKVLFLIYLFGLSVFGTEPADTMRTITEETVTLSEVEVLGSRASMSAASRQRQVSVFDARLIESAQVSTPKDLAFLAPNIYMPDYGSAMTSSVYIRGLGSRINEPVMTMVVDGVPLLDKNMYDHAMQDVSRIELLRGPQGSLYGRNSPGGVMEIHTTRPLDLSTEQVRGLVSYGTANSLQAQASYYQPTANSTGQETEFGWGIAARYRRTDGYYTNSFDGSGVDDGQQAGARLVLDGKPSDAWRVTSTLWCDWVKQGAFPYADANTGRIDYNQPGSYERLALIPSVSAEYQKNGYRLWLSGSYQFMHDDMLMDNDYTPADIFTLNQKQDMHNVTADALLRAPKPCEWYEWTLGASCFMKSNDMQAPVVFMRQGIDELILANANNGIQSAFPGEGIKISNMTLPIASTFDMLGCSAALYHQSRFHFGHWHMDMGVRVDYEHTRMDYLSTADVDYLFTAMMSKYKNVHTEICGRQQANYLQILPRLAVSYDDTWGTVYGYAAKGYKAGGYNPQMFSTVTQNQLMTDLPADMGIHLNITDARYTDVAITGYKPETDWTFELGAHFTPANGLKMDVCVFHTQCYDQQVTVFPDGKTTGRMMANAARSRMWGAEAALQYRWYKDRWTGMTEASYGFTDARFISFNDGMGDYAGKVIPYAPQHTAHALVSAEYSIGEKGLQRIGLTVKGDGLGRIYWNEQNDCSQSFYGLLGAALTFEWKHLQLRLWGKNLTGTRYDTFYFRSMGNDFLQRGKPRETGADIIINI